MGGKSRKRSCNTLIEISYIPIDQLKTYENNAKIHTQDQIDKIKLLILIKKIMKL